MSQRVANRSGKRGKKKKKPNKSLVLIIDLLLVVLLLFSLVMLTVEIVKYIRSRNTYAQLKETAVTEVASSVNDATEDEALEDSATEEEAATPSLVTEEAPVTERVLSTEPGITVDWEALAKENKDVAAWLYCSGTIINYPVVLGSDNEYYIDHDFYGKTDECGTLFFDCCTTLNETGPGNWIIYGHRRNDRSMFGMLSRWGNESFLERYPVMYLLTPEHSYRVELFACRTIHAEAKYFPTYFNDGDALNAYVEKALSQSYWTTDVEVQPDDIILTMVTCNKYDVTTNPRLLLHGRLVALD